MDTYYDMVDSLPDSITLPEDAAPETVVAIMAVIPFLCSVPDENLDQAVATAPEALPRELLVQLAKAIRFWRRTGKFKQFFKASAKLPHLPKPKHHKPPLVDPRQMDLF